VLCLKVTELPFFASKVRLGRCGIEKILPLGPLNEFERFEAVHILFLLLACI
jgi:hypothetical protein